MTNDRFDHGINRRQLIRRAAAAMGAFAVPSLCRTPSATAARQSGGKPRVAAIITHYRGYSHADVILGRFVKGYTLGAEGFWPRTKVVSMYVDQFPPSDLSRGMAAGYDIQIKPAIEQALTLGGDELAVDGVLIIGEHGDYPHNEKGQHMYPRRRFFEETVNTFRKTGGTAPVFNDKHLGFAWEDAKWMYDTARRMQFPLMAGSSLPTTWRKPDIELPLDVELEEAVAIGYGGIEAYGFHALETLQCMIERRRGGEAGVTAVTCLEGDSVWEAGRRGRWSRELLDAALSRVDQKQPGRPEANCANPATYLIEHTDGFRSSVLMLDGHSSSFAFAAKIKGQPSPVSTQFWLQEPDFGHFAYLTHNIESMFLSGKETYPPERTLLTTGVLDAVMTSRFEQHQRIETPWMSGLSYRPGSQSVRFARFGDFHANQ
jgi:hypothetical protein